MSDIWMVKASWYELLSLVFGEAKPETGTALASGELAEAFREIAGALEIDAAEASRISEGFASVGDADTAFHELRKEATRLFFGMKKDPLVIPYAGVWSAVCSRQKPLLVVGKESIAIEGFMKDCGVVRPEGYGGPIDHMSTILEFMSYLCVWCADAFATGIDALAQERVAKYERFYHEHFIEFARYFAGKVLARTSSPVFAAAAKALQLMPNEPL